MERGTKKSVAPELSLGSPTEGDARERPEVDDSASDHPYREPAIFEYDDGSGNEPANDAGDGTRKDTAGDPELELGDAESERSDTESEQSDADEATSSEGEHPAPPAQRGESGGMFEAAKAAWRAGRVDEAVQRYRELVATDPGHVRARNNLGVLLDREGSHEAALEHFQAALEVEPENVEVLTNHGAALAALGLYDDAEAHLRRAMRIEPGRLDVRANLGILYFRRGLYAQAEAELGWVCEQDPEHATAHFYRGEALNRLGRVDDALETLERASQLQPDSPRVYYLLGILYDKKHLRDEAGLMYRKARELSER